MVVTAQGVDPQQKSQGMKWWSFDLRKVDTHREYYRPTNCHSTTINKSRLLWIFSHRFRNVTNGYFKLGNHINHTKKFRCKFWERKSTFPHYCDAADSPALNTWPIGCYAQHYPIWSGISPMNAKTQLAFIIWLNFCLISGFLNVYLLDAVSGSIIFHANHKRVSGNVNLVHSENWVVVSSFFLFSPLFGFSHWEYHFQSCIAFETPFSLALKLF